MIIDGNKIAGEIKQGLKDELSKISDETGENPEISLGVVLVGRNPISLKYVNKKRILGGEVGVSVKVFNFDENIEEEKLSDEIKKIVSECDGVIVQLPLPKHIETQKILNLVPTEKDVDCLSEISISEGKIFSPVVGSIKKILDSAGIRELRGMKTAIVGRGRLVGKPASLWLKKEGANVESFGKDGGEAMFDSIRKAELLVLCAGQPGLIKPEMIKDGVILIDASTSEVSGQLRGDADPECESKCKVFTPVPGGVGPLTVVMLFRNLLDLWKENKRF